MRYKVLVADDEPIILSGIRHLINWEDADAVICGTASNGAEAYAIIEREHPDIVITDIRMPVMDGLALAGKCSEEFPDIVFIILTSLMEFSLAKEAIRYGISDYLLKTELTGERLLKSLDKAERECLRRRGGRDRDDERSETSISSAIANLFIMREVTQGTRTMLYERGLLDDFVFFSLVFTFPSPSLEKQWSTADYKKLHEWEQDIAGKIIPSFFSVSFPVIPVSGKEGTLLYFASSVDESTWQAVSLRAESKIRDASAMVTGLTPSLLHTHVYHGRDNLRKARDEMESLMMAFYLGKDRNTLSPASLDVDAVFPKLEAAIARADIVSCKTCFSIIRQAVATTDHSLSQFEFAVSALRSALSSGLSAIGLKEEAMVADIFDSIDFIMTRSESLEFLDDTENSLLSIFGNKTGAGSAVADKAREFVMNHIMERIVLGDVASCACVSPSYMSKVFKRTMGISLIDYINKMKVEKAKDLMASSRTERIADIALALGFANIYYFSKVFRKVEGISPSEYMKKIVNDNSKIGI